MTPTSIWWSKFAASVGERARASSWAAHVAIAAAPLLRLAPAARAAIVDVRPVAHHIRALGLQHGLATFGPDARLS